MEKKFYKDDFENFLEEQANNHRMFPSDKLWGNIHSELHEDKTWPALTIAALGFLAAIISIGIYFSPKPNIFAYKPEDVAKTIQQPSASSNSLIGSVSNTTKKSISRWTFDTDDQSFKSMQTKTPLAEAVVEDKIASISKPVENRLPEIVTHQVVRKSNLLANVKTVRETARSEKKLDEIETKRTSESATEISESVIDFNAQKNSVIFGKEHENTTPSIQLARTSSSAKSRNKLFRNNFSYLVYITPSVSFRKLREDGSFMSQKVANSSGPVDMSNVTDVNRIVRHAPGRGAEAGVSLRYNLNDKLKVTTGLQFNVRQYSMEAFASNAEVATIALQRTSGVDSVVRYSYYRTTNGITPTEIVNRYYQLSMPVGVEWEVIGSKNISFNIAAAVQPTYNLNQDSYLISTNFKNYTESGSILRNWNLNTNIEAFINFKNGDYRWQIGPQFRYQQLSSFIKAYPIKENLLDYGLKIGVSKVIQ